MLQRDYFAGVLANRSGHIDDSILLLNRALPNIRESQAKRAAIALEALADDYNKSFRYGDAAPELTLTWKNCGGASSPTS